MPSNRPNQRRASDRRPAAPGSAARSARPGGPRRPTPSAPPARPGFRAALEKASYPILVTLTRAPKWLLGVVTAAVLLGGLLAPAPWGPILLGLVVLFLAWLLTLAWPKLTQGSRVIRALIIVGLAGLVAAQAAGWL